MSYFFTIIIFISVRNICEKQKNLFSCQKRITVIRIIATTITITNNNNSAATICLYVTVRPSVCLSFPLTIFSCNCLSVRLSVYPCVIYYIHNNNNTIICMTVMAKNIYWEQQNKKWNNLKKLYVNICYYQREWKDEGVLVC